MQLFNLIIVPCLVVVTLSPDCFYTAIVAASPVTAHFEYKECTEYTAREGCLLYSNNIASVSYQPPFTYSYQCSSSLITYYAPTFVYMGLIVTFVNPVTGKNL